MSQTNTLAPCPFCGGVPHLKPSTRGDYTSIVCPIESVCGGPIAVVIPNDQIEEGIAAWNCRAPTPVSAMALTDEAYDLIDRYLRNNLDDTDYAEYSTALEAVRVAPAPASQPVAVPAGMEPVAWAVAGNVTNWSKDFSKYKTQHYVQPVFTAAQVQAMLAAAPSGPARQPLTDAMVQQLVIAVCDSIYPQDNASYSEADSVFYGAFARAIEHHHGIK